MRGTGYEVIALLREGRTLSGEVLAGQLGVTRAAVHKAVEALRRRGFDIGGSAGSGYLLRAVPDVPVEEAVVPQLSPGAFGREGFVHLQSVGSTNTYAAELARQGAAHGTVVVAEEQTAGRGRRGRSFASPAGAGLYLSVILRPALSPREAWRLTLCGAHAVVDACRDAGLNARLKWPNDVLVDGKKLCGILTELSADSEHIHQAVLGIGVNVRTTADELPPELRDIATSVAVAAGHDVGRVPFCISLLEALTSWYGVTLSNFPRVVQRARECSATLGRRIRISNGGAADVEGNAEDLDDDGALVVRTHDGAVRVVAGDVEHL